MLRWVILVVAVVAMTAVATLAVQYMPDPADTSKIVAATPTGPQPKVVIDEDPTYDFGKMSQHDKSSHTWLVRNEGEADLDLWIQGRPTCSCTIAKLEGGKKATLKPGVATTIDLEWNTKEFKDDYSQGATFGTNDPRMPTFNLTIKGKVYPPVVIMPPEMIQFPRISNEESHRAKFAVYSQERPELKVLKVTSSKPELIVAQTRELTDEEVKQLKIKRGTMVTVEVKPGMPLGTFHEELVVQTDHPKQPMTRMSVGGLIYGPISVTPPGARMSNVNAQKGASMDILMTVRGGKETRFEVADKPAKIEVSVHRDDKVDPKGRYRLTVAVPPGTAAGEVEGIIVLKTDHKFARELRIPVTILISRSGAG
jgi:hypothetical protein